MLKHKAKWASSVEECLAAPTPPPPPRVLGENDFTACFNCLREDDLMRCANCKAAYYCSKVCQVDHWPQHAAECSHVAARNALNAAREAAATAAAEPRHKRPKTVFREQARERRGRRGSPLARRLKPGGVAPAAVVVPASPLSATAPMSPVAVPDAAGAPPAPPVVFVNGIEQQQQQQQQRRPWTVRLPQAEEEEELESLGVRVRRQRAHAPLSLSDVERVDWSQQLLSARLTARLGADVKASTDPLSNEAL